ncbi:MAG: carbon starvation CstA family protein [Eubacteriales bacterium]|nr:carbon starvation CstA family protein [Eubacteriales bacterium]MDY3332524.1 carbon starvation CstA family protein [Gallibacter sp.]
MITFLIGLLILIVGGMLYGRYCEKVFGPDDRDTPAVALGDGVDYVPMRNWRNSLIELLNIAGTGPIIGPIQGILFGPLAFITIPIGNILAGSMHDYFSGMISMRNNGAQMPRLIQKYLGNKTRGFYNIVIMILMLMVGAVFIYTPGDLIVTDLLGQKATAGNATTWIVYGGIFLYYLIATLFPIDKIIGKVYPILGAILLISAIGIFVGILFNSSGLQNLDVTNIKVQNISGSPWIPIFFITVACGILSGFHATQATLISRSVKSERHGRMTFFNMMLVEGFIAMCWAAGAMILFNGGIDVKTPATLMIGNISREFLGGIGAYFAIAGVIVLPITSGDTALRSLRLMIAEHFHIDQVKWSKRVMVSAAIFVPVIFILVWAKLQPAGFSLLWRYFAFTNQFIAIFALSMITVYLSIHQKNRLISLIPGMFYTFVVMSFILHASIGFNLDTLFGRADYMISYVVAGVITVLYAYLTLNYAKKHGMSIEDRKLV